MAAGEAVRVGCCGFPLGRARYYAIFETVEIQQTFYQPPKVETARRWRAEAPAQFRFALKAWQLITHEATSPTYRRLKLELSPEAAKRCGSFKPTDEVFSAWEATRRIALALEARYVLFQSPASFAPSAENRKNARRFFSAIERAGLALAWEPRGAWREEEILALCREFDLVHAVDPLKAKPLYGGCGYFRLHGPRGYRSSYGDGELRRVASLCEGETYCFFNNATMLRDARRFQRLLRGCSGESAR
jgi:uncharacterized protein YecE (DUF72 family)